MPHRSNSQAPSRGQSNSRTSSQTNTRRQTISTDSSRRRTSRLAEAQEAAAEARRAAFLRLSQQQGLGGPANSFLQELNEESDKTKDPSDEEDHQRHDNAANPFDPLPLNVNRNKKFTPEQPPQKEPSNGKPSKPNVTVIADHNPSPKATVDRFAGGPTNSKKGKAVKPATREDSDNGDNDESDDEVNDEDEENCEEEEQTEIAKPKRGRPRKDILKEAAKRMKKY
ncbi:hypothetical protein PtB15_1B291 [Puccinia triticina]|nr:hypothetical protein PtB15_1B291 [Puccinia triticina]